MKLFPDCISNCWSCSCRDGSCLAGNGEDVYTPASNAQIVEWLDENRFNNDRQRLIDELKERGIVYNIPVKGCKSPDFEVMSEEERERLREDIRRQMEKWFVGTLRATRNRENGG